MNEKFSDQPLTACPPTLMDQTSTHDLQTRDVYEAAEISNQNTSYSSNETCGALGQTEESRVEMQVTTRDKANDSDSDAEYLIMSRPHRKIKPVSLFSDLTTEQPVAKSNASKKKTFKPSHRTELLVQAYGKPCTICLKTIKTSSFLECTRCKQLMHMACISSKSRHYNIQRWICPKCLYLRELPQTTSGSKVVVEEIVWALLDGVWLPATAVAREEYHNLSVSVFVNRHSKIENPLAGKRLVQWFDKRRASYSWIEQDQIFDFIHHFQEFAYQTTQFPKRRKIDLETKIKLALRAIPGFRPEGWCPDPNMACDTLDQDIEPAIDFDQPCPVCGSLEAEDKCLICDNCCLNVHYFCIGLSSVPEGAWICPWCSQGIAFNTEKGNKILSCFKNNSCDGPKESTNSSTPYMVIQAGVLDDEHTRSLSIARNEPNTQGSKRRLSNSESKCSGNLFGTQASADASNMQATSNIQNRIPGHQCTSESTSINPFKKSASFETGIYEFYSKLEREYSFNQPGFYGEQDWLEGSLIGYGRIPLPSGPEVISAESQVVLRCGYGLLHGGTLRTEVFKPADKSLQLKVLKYRLRKTSITLQGPMGALHVLQTFSRHVRDEVARNYVMSESILHSIQCKSGTKNRSGCADKHPSLIKHVKPDLFNKYIFDCCPAVIAISEPVLELEFPENFFDCFDSQDLELAAEAAIPCGNLKFNGFKHVEGSTYEAMWIPMF